MTRPTIFICIALSISLVAGAFIIGNHWLLGTLLIIIGGLWAFSLHRKKTWASATGLFVVYGFAALGIWMGLPSGLFMFGGICALLAWDLTDFSLRLKKAGPQDKIREIEKHHFLFLVIVAGIGAVLSAAAMFVHVKVTFGWTVVLIIFAVWGIGRLMNWLLKKES